MPQPVDLFQWRASILSVDGPANPLARLVLITVSMPMKADGTGAWESQTTIAKRAHVGLRTVKRHLEIAERHGWVDRMKVKRSEAKWPRTEYAATVPDAVYDKLPERPWETDPSFRTGATVAPTYKRPRGKKAHQVPTATKVGANGARVGANGDTGLVPQLGLLVLNSNTPKNSSQKGVLTNTVPLSGILEKAKTKTKTPEQEVFEAEERARAIARSKAAARLELVAKYRRAGYSQADATAILSGHGVTPEEIRTVFAEATA